MILDTNAISAIAEKDEGIMEVIATASFLALSFIGYAEFRYGLLGARRPTEGIRLLAELAASLPLLLPDAESLEQYAQIKDELKRNDRPIPDNDIWIAALARQHSIPVLSRDRHFDFVTGVERLTW